MSARHLTVNYHIPASPSKRRCDNPPVGSVSTIIHRLCLLVDDLQAAYAALRNKGVRFKSEPVTITAGPNEGGLVIYFADPDGHMLELFQPPTS